MSIRFNIKDFEFFKKLLFEAGEAAKKIQNNTIEVKRKSDTTIVTQADLLVQEILIQKISQRYSNVHFVHEENYVEQKINIDDMRMSVIIDPIDGTAMYSMYLPIWCISVGIFAGYTPLYGFVYSPGFDMFFYNDDENAYMNNQIKRMNRNLTIDAETNIFYASEVHNQIDIIFPGKIRNLGSTALHACLTIDNNRNRTLAFIGKSRLWDWAGAIPIILKAGGLIKYISGEHINYASIAENNYQLLDYAIAYNSDDFDNVKKYFIKKN